VRILARVRDAAARRAVADAAALLAAEVVHADPETRDLAAQAMAANADVIFVELREGEEVAPHRDSARALGAGLVVACHSREECTDAALGHADEWVLLPAPADRIALRLAVAAERARAAPSPRDDGDAAERVRYHEALHDAATGLPSLPVLLPRIEEWLEADHELTLRYLHFVWFEQIERTYGAERLDEVIGTAADAVREFFAREQAREHVLTMDRAGDEDFILIARAPPHQERAADTAALSHRIERLVRERIAEKHGPEFAALAGLYIGTAAIARDPKIRIERLVYRAVRDAARAALNVEQWEREQKAERLRAMLREGAVRIVYHPIVVTETEEIYGYEALARGEFPGLRSPEVLFQIAQEANLVWELGRLLRRKAVDEIRDRLAPDQYLFLNVDPHDFEDPAFRDMNPESMGIPDPTHVVLEITERVAITDYHRFREHLAAFRALGFRFAVDDAGSGYAGLGSIANLAPDYIKLDISLIADIDTNFLKQNLVETMVNFAEGQGARVVAEGVERPEEFETIRELGVHLAQGFLFERPGSASAAA
jgi:EAL domain-containing protein (putative c-di-GMP-specific phosphodiesterase class I)/GGDEF domain-containing protein